jgi:hypothetical protein
VTPQIRKMKPRKAFVYFMFISILNGFFVNAIIPSGEELTIPYGPPQAQADLYSSTPVLRDNDRYVGPNKNLFKHLKIDSLLNSRQNEVINAYKYFGELSRIRDYLEVPFDDNDNNEVKVVQRYLQRMYNNEIIWRLPYIYTLTSNEHAQKIVDRLCFNIDIFELDKYKPNDKNDDISALINSHKRQITDGSVLNVLPDPRFRLEIIDEQNDYNLNRIPKDIGTLQELKASGLYSKLYWGSVSRFMNGDHHGKDLEYMRN